MTTIAPGVGWTRTAGSGYGTPPTESASQIGVGTEKVVARFDAASYNGLTLVGADWEVGVVADSIHGVSYVDFYLESDTPTRVSSRSVNGNTGRASFNITLDDSAFSGDGAATLYARVVPTAGYERLLSMTVHRNSGGTITVRQKYVSPTGSDSTGDGSSGNPVATIEKAAALIAPSGSGNDLSQCEIILAPGDYAFNPSASLNWWASSTTASGHLTIRASSSANRDTTRITSAIGAQKFSNRVDLIFKDLSIGAGVTASAASFVHLNNVRCFEVNALGRLVDPFNEGGAGATGTYYWVSGPDPDHISAVDCSWTNVHKGPTGFRLLRCTVQTTSDDGIEDCQVAQDVTVGDINAAPWNATYPAAQARHPDVGSIASGNVFWDGIKASDSHAQGLYVANNSADTIGVAVWNMLAAMLADSNTSQLRCDTTHVVRHVVLRNCTIDQTFQIHTDTDTNHYLFEGCIFSKMIKQGTPDPDLSSLTATANGYLDITSASTIHPGTAAFTDKTWDQVVNDHSVGDYTPVTSGPAAAALASIILTDADGNLRGTNTAAGAFRAANEAAIVSPRVGAKVKIDEATVHKMVTEAFATATNLRALVRSEIGDEEPNDAGLLAMHTELTITPRPRVSGDDQPDFADVKVTIEIKANESQQERSPAAVSSAAAEVAAALDEYTAVDPSSTDVEHILDLGRSATAIRTGDPQGLRGAASATVTNEGTVQRVTGNSRQNYTA